MTDAHREDGDSVEPVGEQPTGPAGRPAHAGRSGQGSHGGDASAEPGGEDEYDVPADLSSLDDTPPAEAPQAESASTRAHTAMSTPTPDAPPSTSTTCAGSRRSTSNTSGASTATGTSPVTAA